MNREFVTQRKLGNEYLLNKIVSIFSQAGVISIHQFGSFAKGTADELSDHDLWITGKDADIEKIIRARDELFSKVGSVILKSEPPQNAPPEGMYSLVIYETDFGFYHVDYFLVPKSKSKILPESKLLYGDDSLPRGDWFSDQFALNIPPDKTPDFRINFILSFCFIGVKYVMRNSKPFMDLLAKEYRENREDFFPKLEELTNHYDFNTIIFILDQHSKIADLQQKKTINKIKTYIEEVENSISV